jgi:hypothetical protein
MRPEGPPAMGSTCRPTRPATKLRKTASPTLGPTLEALIAEIAAYQKALTVDELYSLDAYLCGRYGLAK